MPQATAVLVTLLYWCVSTYYIQAHIGSAPGLRRLLVSLPFFVGSFCIPLLYDYQGDPLTVMTVFSMLCLASFKVLAWCMNRGPLCLPFTPAQFLAILHFPVMPAEVTKTTTVVALDSSDDASKLLTRCITKIALLGAFNQIVAAGFLPALLQTYCLGLSMCFFLGAVQDMMAFIATHWLSLRVAPLFDQPWLSKTTGEWWSHRWNVPASLIFRVLVYDPIIERRWVLPPGELAGTPRGGKVSSLQRAAAMAASFGLSGFGHEVMYWFGMRHFSGWWTVFFMIQAPIAIIERSLKKQLEAAGLHLPPWLHMLRANFLVTYTAHLFFIGAASRDGLTDRVHDSIASSFNALLHPLTGHPTIAQPVGA